MSPPTPPGSVAGADSPLFADPSLARFFVNNRRDGARLLSSALVICGAGLIRIDHPTGQAIALLAGMVSLYWWTCYRRLTP